MTAMRRSSTPPEIAEHVKYSWYDPSEGGVPPFDGESDPAPERTEAYSWAKAPRYAGQPAEAGPLARMVNDQDPFVMDLLARHGPSAFVREMARLHETIRLLHQIGPWLDEVDPEEPFYRETPRAESGLGHRPGGGAAGHAGALDPRGGGEDPELPDHHADRLEPLAEGFRGYARGRWRRRSSGTPFRDPGAAGGHVATS